MDTTETWKYGYNAQKKRWTNSLNAQNTSLKKCRFSSGN